MSIYVKLDSRNRVSLTKVSKNLFDLYRVSIHGDKIILEPVVEIPEEERWLFEPKNKHILSEVKKSLAQEANIPWEKIKKNLK